MDTITTCSSMFLLGLDISAREKQGNPKVDDGFKVPKEKITWTAASIDVDEEFESSGVEETRSSTVTSFQYSFLLILLVISMVTETLDEKKSEEEELKDKGNEEGRFIKFLGPYYMLLITKRRWIGALFRHNVSAVSKSEMIPLPNSSVNPSITDFRKENRSSSILLKNFVYC
ncbi:hypothetical protein GOBAR_DD15962 [Gossypium barbadense]|nr:hypothetical protein GOBAR_DD15962 [Gossypium barbadense]